MYMATSSRRCCRSRKRLACWLLPKPASETLAATIPVDSARIMQWSLRGGCAMSTSYETYPYRPLPRRRQSYSPALFFVFFPAGLLALFLVYRLGLFQQGNGVNPNAAPRTVTPRGDLWTEE